jgi:uncharacterized membrane protein
MTGGLVLILAGLIASLSGVNSSSFGAVILIGPFPVMLGSGPYGAPLVLVAGLLTLVALIIFFLTTYTRLRTH